SIVSEKQCPQYVCHLPRTTHGLGGIVVTILYRDARTRVRSVGGPATPVERTNDDILRRGVVIGDASVTEVKIGKIRTGLERPALIAAVIEELGFSMRLDRE